MEITKLSSKGQVVIPEKVRKDFEVGTPFLVTELDDMIILKKMPGITKEELKTLKGIRKAWQDIERGKAKKFNSVDDFIKEFKTW